MYSLVISMTASAKIYGHTTFYALKHTSTFQIFFMDSP